MLKFKRALVTGASKGLGQEIVRNLCTRCENLVLAARNEEALKAFKDTLIKDHKFRGSIDIIVVDLTQKNAIETFKAYKEEVDLVVNNAGLGYMHHFEVNTSDEIHQMIMVNNYNLTMISHHFVKEMLKAKKGQIINISSIAGLIPTPLFSVYGASKAFVVSLSKSLDAEYKDRGLRVKAFCPGGIKTQFHRSAGMSDNIVTVNGKFMETPEKTAQDVMALIDGNSTIMVPRFYNKAIKFFSHVIPTSMMANETKKMYSQFLKAKDKV